MGRIFLPLGMKRTELGLGPGVSMEDCVPIGGTGGDSPAGLGNTRYWRDMGHVKYTQASVSFIMDLA
jgi:hypothetical protein